MRIAICAGWMGAGRQGVLFTVITDRKGQEWGVVQWDDVEDPDLHKMAGLVKAAEYLTEIVRAVPVVQPEGGAADSGPMAIYVSGFGSIRSGSGDLGASTAGG